MTEKKERRCWARNLSLVRCPEAARPLGYFCDDHPNWLRRVLIAFLMGSLIAIFHGSLYDGFKSLINSQVEPPEPLIELPRRLTLTYLVDNLTRLSPTEADAATRSYEGVELTFRCKKLNRPSGRPVGIASGQASVNTNTGESSETSTPYSYQCGTIEGVFVECTFRQEYRELAANKTATQPWKQSIEGYIDQISIQASSNPERPTKVVGIKLTDCLFKDTYSPSIR